VKGSPCTGEWKQVFTRRRKDDVATGKKMETQKETVHDDGRVTPTGRYLDGRIKSLILDLTAPRAGERLLDVGCGSGEHLGLFRRKGCDVTGIDPSSLLLDQASQQLHSRAELRLGRAEDLPFSDNEFDIVTLIASSSSPATPAWPSPRRSGSAGGGSSSG